MADRGLSLEAIRRERIGYAPDGTETPPWPDWPAFVFPCRKKRFWPQVPERAGKPAKCVALPGSAAALDVEPPPGRTLLVGEGEFDCALMRQHGLPAVTSTAGTSWDPAWDPYVAGRRVAVVYDAGPHSFELARRRAAEFVAAGARQAWAVDLTLAGLARGEDVTDWFVTHGRTVEALRRTIRRARRAA